LVHFVWTFDEEAIVQLQIEGPSYAIDHVGPWHEPDQRRCPLYFRTWGISGSDLNGRFWSRLTHLYGPAVRCKPNVKKWRGVGLAHLYPALAWSVCAPGHHGYPRAPDLILGKAPKRPLGSPDHGYDGETVSPSPQFNSQTSAGIAVHSSVAPGISLGHPLGGPERVDLMRPLARRALRSCDLVPTQSKRSAPAYWRVRLPGHYGVSVVPQP
jgi:hypothetical protein